MADYMRRFRKALDKTDKGELNMADADWAVASGCMEDYGHGHIWLIKDEVKMAKAIEKYISTLEEDNE